MRVIDWLLTYLAVQDPLRWSKPLPGGQSEGKVNPVGDIQINTVHLN